jgi:transposase
MRALVEHRDDLVKTRTQTVNRLHVLLAHLTPGGAPRGLTADRAVDILRQIQPREPAAKTLRGLAVDLVAEIRQLDRRIAKAATDIAAAVKASGSTLTELSGIGTLNAAKVIARVDTIDRFRSADAFATYTGTARSQHLQATSPATGSRVRATGNSTVACTPWRSTRSAETFRGETTTDESEQSARATEKPCAASNDAYPMLSTDSSLMMQTP